MSAKISLCMICKDEEKTLFRCLHHVVDFVDEMVIVDTGSTDRTREHARRFTDRVFDFAWQDDFSEARNFSIARARNDWILFLDADEVIYRAELEQLSGLMRAGDFTGVVLDRHEFEIDYTKLDFDDDIPWPNVETRVEPKLRLVKNTGQLRYVGRIHESLDFTRRTSMDIRANIKFAHYRDKNRKRAKQDYYMALEEEALLREPRNSNAHHNALQAYVMRGWRDHFNEGLRHVSYIEPRFLKLFEELRLQLLDAGWHEESGRIGTLIARNRAGAAR